MKGTFMRAVATPIVFAFMLSSAASAFAQGEAPPSSAEQAEETAAEERAAQFVGVTGPEAESIPGGPLLLGAYAVVWVLLFLFLFRMRGLQRQTAEELERLAAEVRATEGS
jgi:CcmD family protein